MTTWRAIIKECVVPGSISPYHSTQAHHVRPFHPGVHKCLCMQTSSAYCSMHAGFIGPYHSTQVSSTHIVLPIRKDKSSSFATTCLKLFSWAAGIAVSTSYIFPTAVAKVSDWCVRLMNTKFLTGLDTCTYIFSRYAVIGLFMISKFMLA